MIAQISYLCREFPRYEKIFAFAVVRNICAWRRRVRNDGYIKRDCRRHRHLCCSGRQPYLGVCRRSCSGRPLSDLSKTDGTQTSNAASCGSNSYWQRYGGVFAVIHISSHCQIYLRTAPWGVFRRWSYRVHPFG